MGICVGEGTEVLNKLFASENIDLSESIKETQKLGFLYLIVHLLLEILYIGVNCTPMIYLNIISILIYVSIIYISIQGRNVLARWIAMVEILTHATLGSVFMGYHCGYSLWIIATFLVLFIPYFTPTYNRKLRIIGAVYGLLTVVIFVALKVFSIYGKLPDKYAVSGTTGNYFYIVNALFILLNIFMYMNLYSYRMDQNSLKLKQMSEMDYLTGLYNRNYMMKMFDHMIGKKNKSHNTDFSLAILDLDFFKKINDEFGHVAGDQVLTQISIILKDTGSDGIVAGRWGGEEFILMPSKDHSYDSFCDVLEKLCHIISEQKFVFEGKEIRVTASLGAANYEDGMNIVDLVKKADMRLYDAKESGRNKLVC